MSDQPQTIFTIGHSNIDLEAFGDLLLAQEIEVVVDVRSSPYTKFAVALMPVVASAPAPNHGFVRARYTINACRAGSLTLNVHPSAVL